VDVEGERVISLLAGGKGAGRAGPQALDEFTEWKAVSVDFSGRVQKAQGID
jgi:hypothetical protein